MPTFQRHIYSIRLRTGRFFNTDRFILFIAMQWTHFQSWQMGKKLWNIATSFLWIFRKIVRLFANFSASYLFHPAQNGKVFQHRPIYFIHTNAVNPFSKLSNGEKIVKDRYKLLILLARNRASPWQLFSVILIPSGSEREGFSTQTDWPYSCHCQNLPTNSNASFQGKPIF